MADDDEAALVAAQEVAQPDDRVGVEVVRRLVEQQRVRAAEQDSGQLDPAALAARERAQRLAEHPVGEAETCRDRRRLGLGRVAAEDVQPLLGRAVPRDRLLRRRPPSRPRLRAGRRRRRRARGPRAPGRGPARRDRRYAGPAAGSRQCRGARSCPLRAASRPRARRPGSSCRRRCGRPGRPGRRGRPGRWQRRAAAARQRATRHRWR